MNGGVIEENRSAGQLGEQRGAMLVTPSTQAVSWQGLMWTRTLTVPGHLWSATGWVGERHRLQHLFSSQAICSVCLVLPVGLWGTRGATCPTTKDCGQG